MINNNNNNRHIEDSNLDIHDQKVLIELAQEVEYYRIKCKQLKLDVESLKVKSEKEKAANIKSEEKQLKKFKKTEMTNTKSMENVLRDIMKAIKVQNAEQKEEIRELKLRNLDLIKQVKENQNTITESDRHYKKKLKEMQT